MKRLVLLLCMFCLFGCQSNTRAKPGVVVSPESDVADSTSTTNSTDSTDSTNNTNNTNNTNSEDTTTTAQDSFAEASLDVDRAQTTGNLQHPELTEVSGMATSTRQSNTFWAINDSGNAAKLFAFDHKGVSLGNWRVNTENRDWEDMASAWINGESYLLIADIGDNLQVKDEHVVHIFTEPLLNDALNDQLDPIHTIRFRYPDASHNSESMAVGGEWLYVLTKEPLENGERQASRVYRIPISLNELSQPPVRDAELIAELAIPASSIESNLIASIGGVDVSQPTALDIDQQNQTAFMLTYRSIYRYQREANQSWAQVFAQPRQRIHSHSLSQAEALAVADNGVVWFTSEKRPAPLWALPGEASN